MPRGYLPKPQSTAPRGAPRHSPATASTIDRLIERIGLVSAVREAQRVGSHASGPESPRLHAGHIHIEIGRDRPSSQTDLQFLWRCNGSRGGGGDELSGTECQSVCSSSRERYDPVIHPTCNVSGSVYKSSSTSGLPLRLSSMTSSRGWCHRPLASAIPMRTAVSA